MLSSETSGAMDSLSSFTPSPPRPALDPQPTPPKQTTSLAPSPSLIRKRPAARVKRRMALCGASREQLQEHLCDILQQLDYSRPGEEITKSIPTSPRNDSSSRSSPPTPHALPYPDDPLPTYHIYDRSQRPTNLHSQHPRFRHRTETLFRKADQLAQTANTEVYTVVRFPGSFMVYNSSNSDALSPPEPKDSETITTVQISEEAFND